MEERISLLFRCFFDSHMSSNIHIIDKSNCGDTIILNVYMMAVLAVSNLISMYSYPASIFHLTLVEVKNIQFLLKSRISFSHVLKSMIFYSLCFIHYFNSATTFIVRIFY